MIELRNIKICYLFFFDFFDIFVNVGLCFVFFFKYEYIRFRSEFFIYFLILVLNGDVKFGMDLILLIIFVRLMKNNFESYGY